MRIHLNFDIVRAVAEQYGISLIWSHLRDRAKQTGDTYVTLLKDGQYVVHEPGFDGKIYKNKDKLPWN